MRTLTRPELTAALAARQGLIERRRLDPAEAIRRLTPLQGQHPPAPFIALAARLDGFTRADLEAALAARGVVKTTLMRMTLHLAAADEYPAYAQLVRQVRMRTWRKQYAHLDEAQVTAELGAWLREPRTNGEIRERVWRYEGVDEEMWTPIVFARVLLPLVQLPPAGHWGDRRRPRFVLDPRPLPDPDDGGDARAGALPRRVRAREPRATWRRGPASPSATSPARGSAWRRSSTATSRARRSSTSPGSRCRPPRRRCPPRLLAHWDQPLLAHADRERIIPAEVQPLKLTLSGDPTVTVDGRVAASWAVEREGDAVRLTVTPHVEIRRAARAAIRAEAKRIARFCEPDARTVEVAGV